MADGGKVEGIWDKPKFKIVVFNKGYAFLPLPYFKPTGQTETEILKRNNYTKIAPKELVEWNE